MQRVGSGRGPGDGLGRRQGPRLGGHSVPSHSWSFILRVKRGVLKESKDAAKLSFTTGRGHWIFCLVEGPPWASLNPREDVKQSWSAALPTLTSQPRALAAPAMLQELWPRGRNVRGLQSSHLHKRRPPQQAR